MEGAQRPVEALALLQQYESRLDKLKEDREKMRKVRDYEQSVKRESRGLDPRRSFSTVCVNRLALIFD